MEQVCLYWYQSRPGFFQTFVPQEALMDVQTFLNYLAIQTEYKTSNQMKVFMKLLDHVKE
jgi:hypothetical protein